MTPGPADLSRRVIVADASPVQAQALANILEAEGYEISTAGNAGLALEMAKRDKPGLLICDVSMPGMNGFDLCARIKDDPGLADLPVILTTPLVDPLDIIRGLECRADSFVLRPCDARQMLSLISFALANSQAGQDSGRDSALEVLFGGQKHLVTAGRARILTLLLSACEAAMQRIRLLERTQQIQGAVRVPDRGTQLAPTNRTAANESGRYKAPPFAPRSLRILLIDDDPALLESLRSALQDEGHKVSTSNGGQDGLDAFRESQKAGKPFDLVITDLGMPFVDGRQVVAGMRAMSPATPIILLTGWGQNVINDQDRPLPVDRVLGKPPRIRELRAALAELTGRRATDRQG
jgi:DNA-binding response OmpR family regulator